MYEEPFPILGPRPLGEWRKIRLLPRPHSLDRTPSPVVVSRKREYFKYTPETIGDFAPAAADLGARRPKPIRKSPPLAGLSEVAEGKVSRRRNGWLRRKDSNLDMAS